MSTAVRIQPEWKNSNLNATCPLRKGGSEEPYIIEAASQTFDVGDLLYIDSSGNLAICTVNGSNQLDSAIAGIAVEDASGTTGAVRVIQAIRKDDIYAMNVHHATAASAVTAQAQLGTVRAIIKSTVSSVVRWTVDIENAVEGATDALARVKIVGFMQRGLIEEADGSIQTNKAMAIGDRYGLVLVQFLPFSAASDYNPFIRILQFDT